MRRTDQSDDPCLRASELTLRMGDGYVPTDAERAFLDDHLAHCEDCRLERAVADVLAHTGDSGPADPMDEFSRRRFMNSVVTAALSTESDADAPVEAAPERAADAARAAPRGIRWWWAAAAVLLLAVGVAVGVAWRGWQGGSGRVFRAVSPPAARLVLQSGRVLVDGARPEEGAVLRPGTRVAVTQGRAALALPDEAYVMLEPGAALRVLTLDAKHIELHLARGQLLASVQPRRVRRRFVVITPAGRVEVKGTVFAVQVRGTETRVRVLRGEVQVRDAVGRTLAVPRGQAARLGQGRPSLRPVTAADRRADRARYASLTALGAVDTAAVEIRSQPAGAVVEVDGAPLGHTPLVARMRAGHRLLTVRLPGRTPIQERLTVRSADRLVRDYELGPATAAVVTRSLAAPTGATSPAITARGTSPGAGAAPPMTLAPTVVSRAPAPARVAQRPRVTAPAVPPAARDLIARARERRAARDWRGAAKAYRLLLRRHGRSAEARAARVALGLLLLHQLGDPRGALRLFNAYLASTRSGPLAQEAAYGRIRALRHLGRRNQERQALRDFLHFYPGALQEPFVKARLRRLTTPAPGPRSMSTNKTPVPR